MLLGKLLLRLLLDSRSHQRSSGSGLEGFSKSWEHNVLVWLWVPIVLYSAQYSHSIQLLAHSLTRSLAFHRIFQPNQFKKKKKRQIFLFFFRDVKYLSGGTRLV